MKFIITTISMLALGLSAIAAPLPTDVKQEGELDSRGWKSLQSDLSEGVGIMGKVLTSALSGTAEREGLVPPTSSHLEKRQQLPNRPDRELCYYERPGNLYVKMPCNSGRPGMHCYLETGECDVVTRLGPGHGSLPPNHVP